MASRLGQRGRRRWGLGVEGGGLGKAVFVLKRQRAGYVALRYPAAKGKAALPRLAKAVTEGTLDVVGGYPTTGSICQTFFSPICQVAVLYSPSLEYPPL